MNSNFKTWHDQADIPVQTENGWIDAETGIAYDPNFEYKIPRTRTNINDKAQAARDIAKKFGGKALIGTTKQKEWAEKIRVEKLQAMEDEDRFLACDPNGLLTHSKFWIEHKDKSGKEIGEFVRLQKSLLEQARAMQYVDKDKYVQIANEYNALTAIWFPNAA